MRLSKLLRPRNLPFQLFAAGLLAVLIANPASAEPSGHATTPDLDLSTPSTLAGPQDEVSSQPEPVYPNGEPAIETVESDDAEAVEPSEPIIVATIDKGQQRMTVFVDGVEQYDWPVSTGMPGYATPSGCLLYTSDAADDLLCVDLG